MLLPLLLQALAGEVVFDLKVPARIVLDGEVVAEVHRESVLRVPVADGDHSLVLAVQNEPRSFPLAVGAQPVLVLVGRTGISVGALAEAPEVALPAGDASVRFRVSEKERLLVQIDKQRVVVGPGAGVALPLALGEHALSIRNPDGTQVFARGVLHVAGPGEAVVQISEGRLPETSGDVVSFVAGGP